MSTFTQLKANVRANLNDSGSVSYSSTEMDNSFQDAYDDLVVRTQCIIKKVTLSWVAYEGYPKFFAAPYSVTDYMATVAIFDSVTNRWLDDSLSLRDMKMFRPDWETTLASPQYWCPKDPDRICIFPKYSTAAGTFVLYYWAKAPTVVDGDTPLIPTDLQYLLEMYSTADLLESFEEYTKAKFYWDQYFDEETGFMMLSRRIKNIAKSDLLLLA